MTSLQVRHGYAVIHRHTGEMTVVLWDWPDIYHWMDHLRGLGLVGAGPDYRIERVRVLSRVPASDARPLPQADGDSGR